MESHRRNSLRLREYDYSQPGEYFVTICTADRRCVLGDVVEGKVELSKVGEIVASCWQEIPRHFLNTKVGTFRIMPNHMHGIIQINENPVGVEYIQPLQRNARRYQHVIPNSLESIVRSFKAAVTRESHRKKMSELPLWQHSFYDHIIRNEVDHFFI